jgi:hypothetical protein
MLVAYWIANIAVLFLLHKGMLTAVSKGERKYGKKDLLKGIAITVCYTASHSNLDSPRYSEVARRISTVRIMRWVVE